jgi:hypothetical protein
MTTKYVSESFFTPDVLEALRHEGDPPADAAVAAYFASIEVDRPGHHLMSTLIKHEPGSDELAPGLEEFVGACPPMPMWIDEELLEEGQNLFLEYVPQFGLALWMASIPAGYAGKRDVVVLYRTKELMRHAERRFLETGQFILDVMTPGGLAEGARGPNDIRHVRLMHATSRHLLQHDAADLGVPPWDPKSGVPLNQMALLATMFTFSVVGIRSAEKLGVSFTDRQRDAYAHAWCVVGHLMGIRGDLLPLDFVNSAAVWDRIVERECQEPSEEGRCLTSAAIKVMQGLIPGRFGDGVPAAGIRYLLGRHQADLLDVPHANWTSAVFVPARVLGTVMSRFNRDSIVARWISGQLGKAVFEGFLATERHGGRPVFEVPDQVRRRLGIS